ncbi:MAG: hypothetical protein ACI9CF_001351 [Candidatus Omnitrophota bacterium]|jgi:hypothetical protein
MIKAINIKGIIIVAVSLLVVDSVCAYVLSPLVAPMAVSIINKNIDPKVEFKSVRVHPILLSVDLTQVSISDAENEQRQIMSASKITASIDIWSALKKQMAVSRLHIDDMQISVDKSMDGTIALTAADGSEVEEVTTMDRLKQAIDFGKSDWFTRVFGWIKKELKKDRSSQAKKDAEQTKTADTEVEGLKRGRIIHFGGRDKATFKVGQVKITNAKAIVSNAGQRLPAFEKMNLTLKKFEVNQSNSIVFDSIVGKGEFATDAPGKFKFGIEFKDNVCDSYLELHAFDLAELRPIYSNSLPIAFDRGLLELNSKSHIEEKALDSKNNLTITDHTITKSSMLSITGFVIGPIIEALNKQNPLKLTFDIGGTPDKPSFDGLKKIVMEMAHDEIENSTMNQMKTKASEGAAAIKDKFGELFN